MKNITTAVMLVTGLIMMPLISVAGEVRGSIESQSLKVEGVKGLASQVNLYIHGKPGTLSWSAWSLTGERWSEAYVGPTYSPAKWVGFLPA